MPLTPLYFFIHLCNVERQQPETMNIDKGDITNGISKVKVISRWEGVGQHKTQQSFRTTQ